jgi:hypothetical protein
MKPHTRLIALMVVTLALSGVTTLTAAQDAPPKPGICEGVTCGPSGEFSPTSFPTLTDITWDAFPANVWRWDYAPAAGGREIFVTTTGDDAHDGTAESPLATPMQAVALAQSGDVIWIADGEYAIGADYEYDGLVLDTSGVILAAENVGGVTFVPRVGETTPTTAIAATADDLTVDGFIIQGFESGIMYGRGDSTQRNLTLKHLKIDGVAEGIWGSYAGDGTTPIIDGMLVYDLWLRDISTIGMHCGAGPCDNMRWEALRVEMPGGAEGSGADALAVESGQNVVVFNANISGASADGIDLKSSRVAVANVIVHDIGRNGIKLWDSGDVINALVYNTGADAALVFEAGTYRVLNTLVARHSWDQSAYAMTVAYDSAGQPGRLELINCVFYQNSGAIWVSPSFELDVRHSVFYGSGNDQELIWDPVMVGEGESPISALESAGGGADNLGLVDPLFTNPGAGDYTWGEDSPLLDAGTAAGDILPPFDLYGRTRVYGASVDVSPWELQPESTAP